MMDKPVVSIKCTVFNQEKYLRQCLDGFVMQKTNFPFEAIVHDDASTDHSADIIREYAEKYPNIIKPIYEKENQWSKHDGSLEKIMDNACIGKYIAFCEGDDYWTDPFKLQKQVNYLESHPEIVVCSHTFRVYIQNTHTFYDNRYSNYPFVKEGNQRVYHFDLNNYWKRWAVQPVSCMYRNLPCLREIPRKKYKYFFDVTFYYYYLKMSGGKGALLKDDMAVYRSANGVWASKTSEDQFKFRYKQAYSIFEQEGDRRCLYDCCVTQWNYVLFLIHKRQIKNVLQIYMGIRKFGVDYFLLFTGWVIKYVILYPFRKMKRLIFNVR